MRQKKQSQAGFTIVEVLIVLAVAGLILLMVFFAVPNLQRTSRNNLRKQDVATVLGVLSQYELNNSGEYLIDNAILANKLENKKLVFYPVSNIKVNNGDNSVAENKSITSVDNLDFYNYAKCSSDPAKFGKATSVGAGYDDIVALYAVETGGGGPTGTAQCKELQ